MAAEAQNGERSPRGVPTGVDHSLDSLAKGLANGTISRRKALRLVGAALVGTTLASIPGVAMAAPPPGKGKCQPPKEKVRGVCRCPAQPSCTDSGGTVDQTNCACLCPQDYQYNPLLNQCEAVPGTGCNPSYPDSFVCPGSDFCCVITNGQCCTNPVTGENLGCCPPGAPCCVSPDYHTSAYCVTFSHQPETYGCTIQT
jgi:hypothetical protein